MRRRALSGLKLWRGACCSSARRMLSRFAAWKISGACRFVIRSVLVGGEGCMSGGRSDRSMDMLGEWRRELRGDASAAVVGGVDISIARVAMSVRIVGGLSCWWSIAFISEVAGT